MTYEEVKKIRENPTMADVDNAELHKMIDLAIKKQIPKRANKNGSEYYCPSCYEDEDGPKCVGKNHHDGHKTRHEYCSGCGQKIDWSEE